MLLIYEPKVMRDTSTMQKGLCKDKYNVRTAIAIVSDVLYIVIDG